MDIYFSRIPRMVEHLKLLLKDRYGYEYNPQYHQLNKSIGECLSCKFKDLTLVWFDPVFDIQKNRETQTSSYQLHAANKNEGHVLCISYPKLSPDSRKTYDKLWPKLEVLTSDQLAFPISTHIAIPKHSISDLKFTNLPIIKRTDPVCVWYGFKPGQIIRIDRDSGIVYRIVK